MNFQYPYDIRSPSFSPSPFSPSPRIPTPPSSPRRADEARQQRREVPLCSPRPSAPPTSVAPPTPVQVYGYHENPHPYVAAPDPEPKSFLELAEEGDSNGLVQHLKKFPEAALHLTERRDSALHVAASQGHREAAIVLVGVIDVNAPGFQLRTPLHHAALNGHLKVAIQLLACGAHINAKDAGGVTPMALACKNRHRHLVQTLLAKKAKIDEKAMVMAAESGCWNLVNTFLHQSRGLANVCSDDGHPILVLAAKAKRWNTVKLLLKKGAFATKCKNKKESTLFYATKYRQGEVIELLMSKETKYNMPQLRYAVSYARRKNKAAQKRSSFQP